MRNRHPPRLVAYGAAALATAASLLVRLPLEPALGRGSPFLTFVPAVIFAAYYGGFGPGLMATVLSGAVADYFLIEPIHSLRISGVANAIALVLFLLIGVLISVLCESLHRIARRLVDAERMRADDFARESEERFRGTFENAAVGIVLKDLDGRFLRLNQTFCEIVGRGRSELIGRRWQEITHPDDLGACEECYRLLFSGEAPRFSLEKRYVRQGRSPICVEVTVSLQRDEAGEPAYAIAIVQDISERKRLDVELRRANERLEMALSSSRVALWEQEILPGQEIGRAEWFNFWEQWGSIQPDGDPTSADVMTLVHPDDRDALASRIRSALGGDAGEFTSTHRLQHRDGTYHWVLAQGTIHRDGRGRAASWGGCTIDITDLKRAEDALRESEVRFRGTFENAAVGIAHVDARSCCLRANRKMCEILGYSSDELIGKMVPEVTHPDDLAPNLALFGSLMRGALPTFAMEKRFFRQDGSIVSTYLTVSLQRDARGDPAYAIVMVQDISELKRLEEELRVAKEAAEAASRAKDEFLANVSHEIRTPMNAILGMTELALETTLVDEQQHYLRTVKSAADSLLHIINDLLDFSKIEAGKLALDEAEFSLRTTVGAALKTLAMRAHRKGLELVSYVHPDVPDALVGDAGRLGQVLLNLVGNAIKFTETGEVLVRVEDTGGTTAGTDAYLRFIVRDTGIGIPPEKQVSIFRAFEQEDSSTTRKYGGTGLGLTIATRLVALMGGFISVESEPGRGSTFAFTARFRRQPGPPDPGRVRYPLPLDNLRVLIVDDSETNRRILEEWLRGWRMEPTSRADGRAVLDTLRAGFASGRPYAVVLLDSRMPDADGLALAASIREQPELSATRIILLSSGDISRDQARLRDLKIDAHLLKPLQQDELLDAIDRVMDRGRDQMEEARRPEHPQTPLPAQLGTTMPLRVLVAEDDELSAQLLLQALTRQGHEPRLAMDGREALQLAREDAFDLMLLDIHMPELDGFRVVREIREAEDASGRHLPVIALTARSKPEDREKCLAAGMDDFLSKPVRLAELWTAIDRLVAGRPPNNSPQLALIDPAVLLAAVGDDDATLERICRAFRKSLPDRLSAVRDALRDADAPGLSEAAHRLCGLVSVFSTAAASVASEIEDLAATGRVEHCRPLVDRLEGAADDLLRESSGLSIEALRRRRNDVGNPERLGGT